MFPNSASVTPISPYGRHAYRSDHKRLLPASSALPTSLDWPGARVNILAWDAPTYPEDVWIQPACLPYLIPSLKNNARFEKNTQLIPPPLSTKPKAQPTLILKNSAVSVFTEGYSWQRGFLKRGYCVTHLDRLSGEVTFLKRHVVQARIPFSELVPASVSYPVGKRGPQLVLGAPSGTPYVAFSSSVFAAWPVPILWGYVQRFMDVSQPLPDLPQFFMLRKRDPMSVQQAHKSASPNIHWSRCEIAWAEKRLQKACAKLRLASAYPHNSSSTH